MDRATANANLDDLLCNHRLGHDGLSQNGLKQKQLPIHQELQDSIW